MYHMQKVECVWFGGGSAVGPTVGNGRSGKQMGHTQRGKLRKI